MTAPPRNPAFIPAPLVPRDSQPACDGRWDIYDALMDYTAGPHWRWARQQAAELCVACPVASQCLPKAIKLREQWVGPVLSAIREARSGDDAA